DFDLAEVNYTNPNNFFVTFKVTTIFDATETSGGEGGPSESTREDDDEEGDSEEDEDGINIIIEGKGGPDKKMTEAISTTTKKGTLPKTATENYNLIALGIGLLLL